MGVCFFFVEEDDGDIWLGSYDTGISRIPRAHELTDLKDLPVETYFHNHGLPVDMTWTTVTPGTAGTIFFTDAGDMKFNESTGQFEPDDRYPIDGRNGLGITPSIITPDGSTWGSVFGESAMNALHPFGRFIPSSTGPPRWQGLPEVLWTKSGSEDPQCSLSMKRVHALPFGHVVMATTSASTSGHCATCNQPSIAAVRLPAAAILAASLLARSISDQAKSASGDNVRFDHASLGGR